MTFFTDHRPKQAGYLNEYEGEDALIVYDSRTGVCYQLNPSAAVIWRLCDGTNQVSDIVDQIKQVYNLDSDVAEADVRKVLGQFSETSL